PEEFLDADEIFASATPFKTLPVGRVEERILEGAPGEITRRLSHLFDEILAGRDARFKGWLTPV
ncbi:MAG: branched chain amino acid aminotransferase, partial [Desulfobacterales bacterium]|nr:branched chain amino acid aminotransferase [Desulfobacterales bacterium]